LQKAESVTIGVGCGFTYWVGQPGTAIKINNAAKNKRFIVIIYLIFNRDYN